MMRVVDRILLGLLIVDGFVVGLLSVGFVYLRFGGQPIPVVAVLAGLANCVLLWLAARHTESLLRFAPLLGWLIVVAAGAMSGPGGDLLLVPEGTTLLPTIALLAFGLGAPAVLFWSGRLPHPG